MEGFSITFPGLLQGGAIGIVFFIVMLVFRGNLVTKSTLDKMLQQEQQMTTVWKTIAEQSKEAREQDQLALKNAVQGLETVNYLIRQLRALGEESADVASQAERTN